MKGGFDNGTGQGEMWDSNDDDSDIEEDQQSAPKVTVMVIVFATLPIRVWAALLCVAADIPATRKACGFTSHNSSRGCYKCLTYFSITVGEKTDYGTMSVRIGRNEQTNNTEVMVTDTNVPKQKQHRNP